MSDVLGWTLLGILLLSLLVLIISVYLVYSGVLTRIEIRTGSAPVRSITVAYKYTQEGYRDNALLQAECCRIDPHLPTIIIYYDDPKKVTASKCRSAVGTILTEGDQRPSVGQQELYKKLGFQIFTFPEVTHVVSSCFPYRTPLSIFLGMHTVYPQLDVYIKKRKLCAHPFLEIYSSRLIHYIRPLARQSHFYVPEVRGAPKRQPEEEEGSEEDGRTDITGGDSHSECSSVSRTPPSHSRGSSLCPSVTYRERRDSVSAGSDRRRRSSSTSSFEELQLETGGAVTSYGDGGDKLGSQDRGRVVEGEE
ncbi:testis-expressed protein 264 homolog [Trichomycterus rosablanca]|uniref:testis-expressed protein 264 homolog n=1 Tax=Trichomycterus rosablanca TaxID=2290929 RepID=UPI002F360D48